MAQEDSEGSVLIVGAGLAGLLLAQILRKHKIPFMIFEADPALPQRDGWAIGLVE